MLGTRATVHVDLLDEGIDSDGTSYLHGVMAQQGEIRAAGAIEVGYVVRPRSERHEIEIRAAEKLADLRVEARADFVPVDVGLLAPDDLREMGDIRGGPDDVLASICSASANVSVTEALSAFMAGTKMPCLWRVTSSRRTGSWPGRYGGCGWRTRPPGELAT